MPLTVEFDLPEEILQGLLRGEYIRYGGVIRNSAGGIVRHLVETGSSVESYNKEITQTLQALKLSGQFAVGINVITLGVALAGFVYLSQRLNKIEQILLGISDQLKIVEEKIDFIHNKLDVQFLSELRYALEVADNSLMNKDYDARKTQLIVARNAFVKAKSSFFELAEMMRQKGLVGKYYENYYQYITCYALSGIGESRCSLYLDDLNIAEKSLISTKENVGLMSRHLQVSLNPGKLDFLRLSHEEIPRLKLIYGHLQEMNERIDTQGIQVKTLREHKVNYSDFTNMCFKKPIERPILFIKEVS